MFQKAIFSATESSVTPGIELAVRSMNASSWQDAGIVTTSSERGQQSEITASFENASDRNSKFHELSMNDETRGYIPDKVSEFLVPGSHFDRKSHTHHRNCQQIT